MPLLASLLLLAVAACAEPALTAAGAPSAGGGSAPTVSVGGTARAFYGHVR